ncbi:MAG: hypothetical protein II566_07410 [Lachnospiraceae bacterium]|jgi:hypothetical protein|nr:hypothetical protein [Lachnospiraceae bacterium]MBQ2577083.1 hypothetical protein [Lachnospiraceae bacterium]MBQ5430727.1 hypothetical protein [Lachnospiraceae bacterium]
MIDLLFEQIRKAAAEDSLFKENLLKAYEGEHRIIAFCKVCNEKGIEIYPMDLADADESMYAAMRRSTNGGGENSPHLNWQEEAFASLVRDIAGE